MILETFLPINPASASPYGLTTMSLAMPFIYVLVLKKYIKGFVIYNIGKETIASFNLHNRFDILGI